tara:strand:- start:539 stop:2053 length:1515 start_codon:yes stop_codon:yes gene_type:complete
MNLKKILIALIVIIFEGQTVIADVKLPAYFSDGMVLQQQSNMPLWGYGIPDQAIRVHCNWQDTVYETKVSEQGRWEIGIITPKAGGPYEIKITSSKKTVVVKDVLIGEVWLCSGQSNMVFSFSNSKTYEADKKNMNSDHIRYLEVTRNISDTLQKDIKGSSWESLKTGNIESLSAVALYFAQKLNQETKVPIGIIEASWGGTSIDNWMPRDVLEKDPNLTVSINRWETWSREFKKDSIGYQAEIDAWKRGTINYKPEMPTSVYINKRPHRKPASLYNGMIAPLTDFKIKGVIWYQGETNRTWSDAYQYELTAFIETWRKAWGYNFPIGLVQLAPYKGKANEVSEIMLAQLNVSKTINDVGLIVTMDVGDMDDIHPKNKKPVGHRLAHWALEKIYGIYTKNYSGPLFSDYTYMEDTIRLQFANASSGFLPQKIIKGFEYIGFKDDGKLKKPEPMDVVIDGETLIVNEPNIQRPFILRYGWGLKMAEANLYNKDGLPASAFKCLIR